jgi:hypothetical protein
VFRDQRPDFEETVASGDLEIERFLANMQGRNVPGSEMNELNRIYKLYAFFLGLRSLLASKDDRRGSRDNPKANRFIVMGAMTSSRSRIACKLALLSCGTTNATSESDE